MTRASLALLILLVPAFAPAQLAIGAFYKRRAAALTFTTSAQNVPVGMCSNPVTVQTKSSAWATVNVSPALTVNLTTNGSLTFYSDADCENAITSVIIANGQNSATFYYMQESLGSPVAVASATGYATASQSAYIIANPFIWMGGGGNANFNNALNWSGGVVPGSSNVAVFNGDCVTNCSPTITTNPNVAGVRIFSSYTGTITQNNGVDLSIGAKGWRQEGGTYLGSTTTGSIWVSGTFNIAGGTFRATKGQTNIPSKGFAIRTPATFLHGSGTWYIDNCSSPYMVVQGHSLYNLRIANGCNWSGSSLAGTMRVVGTLTMSSSSYQGQFAYGGIIELEGNLVNNSDNWGFSTDTTLKLVGGVGSNVTITGNANGAPIGGMEIASLGTVNFVSRINVNGHFKYTSGTVNFGTSNFAFGTKDGGRTLDPAGLRFYDVTLLNNAYGYSTFATPLYVEHDLYFSNPDNRSGYSGAAIEVKGNVTSTSTGNSGSSSSSTWIMKGTTQTWRSTSSSNNYFAGSAVIDNGSAVTLGSNITTLTGNNQILTINSGSLNMAGFALTIKGLVLNGNTITRNGGVLTVNGAVVPAGTQSLYGGTIEP